MRLRAAAAVPLTLGAALLVWYGGASRKAAPPRTDTSPAPSPPVPPPAPPEIREHVPPGSVLYADDFTDADALGKRLRELIANDVAYARLLEWDIRAFSTFETVRRCPWQCRACELVARRLQRRADRKRNSGGP